MVLPLVAALGVGLLGAGTVAAGTSYMRKIKARRARQQIRALRAAGYVYPIARNPDNTFITDDQIYMLGNAGTRVPVRRFARRKLNNLRSYHAMASYWDLERLIK